MYDIQFRISFILVFSSDHPSKWRPEYAGYMVEGTPGKPYGGMMAHFNLVEANMKLRSVVNIQKLFRIQY